MNILIFEHGSSVKGHRLPYARLLADAIVESGNLPVLAFPDSVLETEEFQDYFPTETNIQRVGFKPFTEGGSYQYFSHTIVELQKTIEATPCDYLILPTADGLAGLMALKSFFRSQLPSKLPVDILLMKSFLPRAKESRLAKMRRAIDEYFLRRGRWHRALHLDPKTVEASPRFKHCKLELCPDPVPECPKDSVESARLKLGLPNNGRIVVSVGQQNASKGTDHLLQAFHRAQLPKDVFLFLAGPMDEPIKQLKQGLFGDDHPQLIVTDRFLSEEEFGLSVVAADVVALPYRLADRPSGICSRAIAWGRPIIASNRGWLLWACDVLQAGISVSVESVEDFGRGLAKALDFAAGFEPSAAAKDYRQLHSVDNFKSTWQRGWANAGRG